MRSDTLRSAGAMGTVCLDSPKVRSAMDRKGLTQQELAEMAHVDQNTVSKAVRGLPIRRHKAALIVASLVRIPDVVGMAEYVGSA